MQLQQSQMLRTQMQLFHSPAQNIWTIAPQSCLAKSCAANHATDVSRDKSLNDLDPHCYVLNLTDHCGTPALFAGEKCEDIFPSCPAMKPLCDDPNADPSIRLFLKLVYCKKSCGTCQSECESYNDRLCEQYLRKGYCNVKLMYRLLFQKN